jgi:hypothetical protein
MWRVCPTSCARKTALAVRDAGATQLLNRRKRAGKGRLGALCPRQRFGGSPR